MTSPDTASKRRQHNQVQPLRQVLRVAQQHGHARSPSTGREEWVAAVSRGGGGGEERTQRVKTHDCACYYARVQLFVLESDIESITIRLASAIPADAVPGRELGRALSPRSDQRGYEMPEHPRQGMRPAVGSGRRVAWRAGCGGGHTDMSALGRQ